MTAPDHSDKQADHSHETADAKVDGDVTEALGGVTSGEQDYVAVNGGGISGERHTPKGDEEVGKGSESNPFEERYPEEERPDSQV